LKSGHLEDQEENVRCGPYGTGLWRWKMDGSGSGWRLKSLALSLWVVGYLQSHYRNLRLRRFELNMAQWLWTKNWKECGDDLNALHREWVKPRKSVFNGGKTLAEVRADELLNMIQQGLLNARPYWIISTSIQCKKSLVPTLVTAAYEWMNEWMKERDEWLTCCHASRSRKHFICWLFGTKVDQVSGCLNIQEFQCICELKPWAGYFSLWSWSTNE
jgi:hypothetical protein